MPESKTCAQCGAAFTRKPHRSHAQWANQCFCRTACANAWRAQQQRPALTTQQQWADAWERYRAAEDRAELRTWKPRLGPHCRISQRPEPRRFSGGVCQACGAMWVSYANRDDTTYCSSCNTRRWRSHGRHQRRAWKAAAPCEVVSPEAIFNRDGYRCQLCGRKTRGKFPLPTSPTLDHIIPLSCGGEHAAANLQCACFNCNSRKGSRSANEQLRLIG